MEPGCAEESNGQVLRRLSSNAIPEVSSSRRYASSTWRGRSVADPRRAATQVSSAGADTAMSETSEAGGKHSLRANATVEAVSSVAGSVPFTTGTSGAAHESTSSSSTYARERSRRYSTSGPSGAERRDTSCMHEAVAESARARRWESAISVARYVSSAAAGGNVSAHSRTASCDGAAASTLR